MANQMFGNKWLFNKIHKFPAVMDNMESLIGIPGGLSAIRDGWVDNEDSWVVIVDKPNSNVLVSKKVLSPIWLPLICLIVIG